MGAPMSTIMLVLWALAALAAARPPRWPDYVEARPPRWPDFFAARPPRWPDFFAVRPPRWPDVLAARPPKWPDTCGSVECPPYNVEHQSGGYELRRYPKATWVTTRVKNSNYDDALRTCFHRLFRYIEGDNAENVKIAMTAPVLGKVGSSGDFEFSFFVPSSVVKPLGDSEISVTETPDDFEVYVTSFGGYAGARDWDKAAEDLKRVLDLSGASYDATHYYTAGYDSPFHFFHRHNEVWIPKAEVMK